MKKAKTAEEVLGETYTALLGSNKNFIISAMEEYAEQARQEERGKSFEMLEMLEKWSILNKEHYRDVSGLIQKTREIIEKATTIKQ